MNLRSLETSGNLIEYIDSKIWARDEEILAFASRFAFGLSYLVSNESTTILSLDPIKLWLYRSWRVVCRKSL